MWAYKTAEIIRLGLQSLKQHAMRSFLTMLGILCGVCAVIAMLAIGEGTSLETQEQFRRLGATNIILKSVKPTDSGSGTNTSNNETVEYGLTYADAERIRSTMPQVEVIVPQRRIPRTVSNLHRKARVEIVGTVPWAADLVTAPVANGRFLTELDERQAINYCVLGNAVAGQLFPYENPVGNTIHVDGTYYRVVGVMAKRGGSSGDSKAQKSDANSEVYIPLSASRVRFGETIFDLDSGNTHSGEKVELHEVFVHVKAVDQVLVTSEIIKGLLKRYHKKVDYAVVVPLEQIRAAQEAGQKFSIMLGAIAAISLLVGGIGIMNIMLASVTERTREIGIRRALGARKRDIIMQFLVETIVISTIGGLLGVAFGIVIPALITKFAEQRTEVTPSSLFLSVVISLAIGIIFGIYPAWRAAQLDPIEALRHE